jgi:hypothetical protein
MAAPSGSTQFRKPGGCYFHRGVFPGAESVPERVKKGVGENNDGSETSVPWGIALYESMLSKVSPEYEGWAAIRIPLILEVESPGLWIGPVGSHFVVQRRADNEAATCWPNLRQLALCLSFVLFALLGPATTL